MAVTSTAATFFAPNVWPDRPAELRDVFLAYFEACALLSTTLCEVFAVALGLDETLGLAGVPLGAGATS